MIGKCIEVLDPTVKVKFCNVTAGIGDMLEREILLPDWQDDICHLSMTVLHKLAHLWYSTPVPREDLNREEQEPLGWLDDAYADYRFCKNHPEFRTGSPQKLWKSAKGAQRVETIDTRYCGVLFSLPNRSSGPTMGAGSPVSGEPVETALGGQGEQSGVVEVIQFEEFFLVLHKQTILAKYA